MMDWQPIETAPKDGTRVFLYGPKRVSAFIKDDLKPSGYWGYADKEPSVFEGYFSGQLWQIGGFGTAQPTHWMPLPEPPKEGE